MEGTQTWGQRKQSEVHLEESLEKARHIAGSCTLERPEGIQGSGVAAENSHRIAR